jgi:Asp-tRNA(Asn)/Glu-tRNA(Gln) amidotransferase A subunit family amidase
VTVWLARPEQPPAGRPVAIKDMLDTAGLVTTYGSILFADHLPARSAEAVLRLEAAGYGVAGKTNLHEFAYGISSQAAFSPSTRTTMARASGGSSSSAPR